MANVRHVQSNDALTPGATSGRVQVHLDVVPLTGAESDLGVPLAEAIELLGGFEGEISDPWGTPHRVDLTRWQSVDPATHVVVLKFDFKDASPRPGPKSLFA